MKKNVINLDRHYMKLYGQISARLLCVEMVSQSKLCHDFSGVDTIYYDEEAGEPKHHGYPNGLLLVLVLLGNKMIPFTITIKGSDKRLLSYEQRIGESFDISVTHKRDDAQQELSLKPPATDAMPYALEPDPESIEAAELADVVGA